MTGHLMPACTLLDRRVIDLPCFFPIFPGTLP